MSPQGTLELVGRLATASNATFLARDQAEGLWVYKPVAGEAPVAGRVMPGPRGPNGPSSR